jgi:hypothetical protein
MAARRIEQTAATRSVVVAETNKKLLGSFSLLAKKRARSKNFIREKRYQFLR